jgi:Tol biopolymer transport system component
MTWRRCVRIVLSLWALTSACESHPIEPVIGALELTISTTGHDFDPDGYSVTVDTASPLAVPTNGSTTIPDLAPGVHTVTLSGLAANCAPATPSPLEVTVPGAAGAVATVEITCTAIYTLAYRGESGIELTDAAGTVHRTLVPSTSPFTNPLAWSPDGRLLAVVIIQADVGKGGVWLANLDDGSLTQFVDLGPLINVTVGVWSPDGRDLLLETYLSGNTCPGGLGRYPLDQSPSLLVYSITHERICRGDGGDRGQSWPGWSPDAGQIVVHDGEQKKTYVLSRDGTNQRLLADGVRPDWSPDGSAIAYVAPVAGHRTLRLIAPEGSNDRPLTAPATNESDTDPAWSPGGSAVAFVRQGLAPDSSVTAVHAYVIDRDGTNERQLGVLPVGSFHPTWSADGLHLAYSGEGGTYAVNVDGSGFRLVTAQLFGSPAQWRP